MDEVFCKSGDDVVRLIDERLPKFLVHGLL